MRVRMLEVLRFMFRDANGIESLVSLELAKMVAQAANLAQGTAANGTTSMVSLPEYMSEQLIRVDSSPRLLPS